MKTPRTAPLLIRFSPAERQALAEAAQAVGQPVGTWLRDVGLREAHRLAAFTLQAKKAFRMPTEQMPKACAVCGTAMADPAQARLIPHNGIVVCQSETCESKGSKLY